MICAGLLAACAQLVLPPVPAMAGAIGTLTVYPGNGLDVTPMKVLTSSGCPAPADAYYASARGHGFPSAGQVVTATTTAGLSRTGGFYADFAQTMKDFAKGNGTTLQGRYDLTVYCVDSFTSTSYGEFSGVIAFTSATAYEALGAARPTTTVTPEPGEPLYQVPLAAGQTAPASSAATGARRSWSLKALGDSRVLWIGLAAACAIAAFLYGRRTSSEGSGGPN